MNYNDKWFCETCQDEVDMDDIDYRFNHTICTDQVILIEGVEFNYMED